MCGLSATMRRVASTPFSPGMCRSMTTTSGWVSLASSTASVPLVAAPTSSVSGLSVSRAVRPSRNSGWSSTISTLIGSVMVAPGRASGR